VIPEAQRPAADLLRRLAGRPPIETHISLVFVGPDTAWKLPKAVRMPFLDFTTLAAREATARREIELNAPHAPGLYRDAAPIRRGPDGELAVGWEAPGETIDWVVRMAPVPEGDFLDAIAARGGLTPSLLDAIADVVAAYLAAAPVVRDADGADIQIAMTQGNLRSARAAVLPEHDLAAWDALMQAELGRRGAWLRARGAAGFVRRGHGDLHLGNMCLFGGRPVPFDAVEFDDVLATGDVGYDLAYLLMDIDHRVGRAAANRVLNRAIARTGDVSLVTGLPLHMAQKAMVRAHVDAARGRAEAGCAYLARSLAYLHPAPPVAVAIGGLQGTGKSTLARALAPDLGRAPGALVLRSDEIRKRQHGVAPEMRLPEAAYSREASRAVFGEIAAGFAEALSAGHAAVADAVFLEPDERAAVTRAAGAVPFTGVWLEASLPVLEGRLAARKSDASDATVAVLRRTAPIDPGDLGPWRRVDASDGGAALAGVQAMLTFQ
jgi:aminoglycoside phosphotransferase family enzyme/predicted kinase